ncbi:hypothetical protein ACI2S5_25315 [Ralstonia nicotianae]|uniref:hypothetical protein n=1 Tax=Ralstonia pseudosolanacearum TaxID=1310165 RepID=UPI0009C0044C|nr:MULTISPECIES: hypothetical protein [Ralstonia]QKL54521.1 hypothetical protein HI816_22210 [Ralstonia solanacearum]MDO3515835.1 hypothetical protein [Ralstonia pseudosolanacearum]MDO3544126.1 hypothetical protein [Ralstonia pseudosolanacearum]QKM25773.1 hypothetical protein HI796_22205 [Ralstonia solanacearum]QKM30581.1 hypothetical protein HI795_22210 [Ralstonia solanacearum]
MKSAEVRLYIYHRASQDETVEERHGVVMGGLKGLGGPLGLNQVPIPSIPDFGDGLYAGYSIKPPLYRGLAISGGYNYRGGRVVFKDRAADDESIEYGFKASNKLVIYKSILHEYFERAISAFRGYRAALFFDSYESAYCGGYIPSENGGTAFDEKGEPVQRNWRCNELRANPEIDVDGRNNIYTLHAAQYWDSKLCQRALEYGPDEVVMRLAGKVPKVERLGDGVYIVLNDDPAMSYDDFLSLNERYKEMLGLK